MIKLKENIPDENIRRLYSAILLQGVEDCLIQKQDFFIYRKDRKNYGYVDNQYKQITYHQAREKRNLLRYRDDARSWFDKDNKDFVFVCNAAGYDPETVISKLNKHILKLIEELKNVR